MRPLVLLPLVVLTAAAPAQERRFMVGGFERLRVDGPFEVEVVPGIPGAVATGDRAALDQVMVRSSGDTLVVSGGPLSWTGRKGATLPQVRVFARSLRGVALNGGAKVRIAEMHGAQVELLQAGAGSLEVASIRADELNANLTGTGPITLAGTAGRVRIRNYGTGSIDASVLTANDASLNSSSSGDIRIHVRFTARATALGSGGISITGKPECILRGPGPMECSGTVIRR
ncbi:DUF2807 domain-containing protein [Sphingomonas psychrotolerans]|uniref:DUF2807 domain-containing protein n=1 Tax=Sphingomonas psychrotolerans TaxID=1327635 RepID=A0ABU3N756_9SPHN|nr:head GIN domain-containing protein [Sphingomonas psychrotolerans]MDT8759301.1 DUF2807 domain-containing protein [Sphingomonas psychrotolerans]